MFKYLSKLKTIDYIVFIIAIAFSAALMWKTFTVEPGYIKPATKVWSDFAATIPLIRSFSFGFNFPPEYPIFAGPPIRYHFVFFMLVGTLERLGIPLDWALNLPSAFAFTALLFLIYLTGVKVFKSRPIGLVAVFLFLFNGSLGYLEFFKNNTISTLTLGDIINNTDFTSFGPYDGKLVSAFWSLNIYTNQRHLALGYASFLLLNLYLFTRRNKLSYKSALTIGILIGLFPFIHLAVFGVMLISLGIQVLFYKPIRKRLILAGSIAVFLGIPQLIWMGQSGVSSELFSPGYLITDLNLFSFIHYWSYNLGLSLLLIPLGYFLVTKDQRRFLLPFLTLFIVGNLIQVSIEVAANHKFFNLFLIGGNFLTASVLVKIWQQNVIAKFLVVPLVLSLTLTGLIDLFPIFNDSNISVKDIPLNRTATFIKDNTPANAVFMNSSYLYTPASLAGRSIFMGWPYFGWSAGYDTNKRADIVNSFYTSQNKPEACNILRTQKLDYFTTQDTSKDSNYPDINTEYFENMFTIAFKDSEENIAVYKVTDNCP